MSNTTPPTGYLVPEQPGSPARPGTVSLSSILLYLLALLSLVSAALAIYQATFMTKDKLLKIFKDGGYAADQADTAASIAPVTLYIGAGISLLVAVLYLVLAMFVGKGKQWARITTWIVVGLFGICCGILGVIGAAGGSAFSGMGTPAGVDQKQITEDTAALLPSWLTPVSMVFGIVSLLASILIVVLLLLPPSHPYFRKQEPVWTPPTYPAP